MHEALVSWRNAAATATYDTTGWDPAAPVSLVTEPDGARARFTAAWTDAAPVRLRGAFAESELVSFGALLDTNLYQSHDVELVLYQNADWTGPLWTSGRAPMLPSLIATEDLALEDPRKFDGRLYEDDFFAWPAHVYRFPPQVYCRSFEWRVWSNGIHADLSPAAGFELDSVWMGDGLLLELRAGTRIAVSLAASSRREGGYTVVEPGGASLRTATIPLDLLDGDVADQLVTMTKRIDGIRPGAFVFDMDDAAASFLYGFLFRLQAEVGREWANGPDLSDTSLTLEEWS
ncbi:hypothetical protein ACW7BJ_33400 [Azospirillum argentinense]